VEANMKGEANSTIAEKFKAKATPEEIAERNERALRDRERYRREMEKSRNEKR
jgi:hypothetical protein